MTRRVFLRTATWAALAAGTTALPAAPSARRKELRIDRILVQVAKGRRLTPVAPNAYAPYRGYDVSEPILRIRTAEGLEGFGRFSGRIESARTGLERLIGADPFRLFRWTGGVVAGPAEESRQWLAELGGADVALFDLLGKALQKPIAALLGEPVRDKVAIYDSSLYMEDLLKPDERRGLAYLKNGPAPENPAEWVARKALWLIQQSDGIRILKIKIGRAKWMPSFEAALERDIAVVKAIHQAVGGEVALFVDGNNGYKPRPAAAAEFASALRAERLYAMEEMFPEEMVEEARDLKRRLRSANQTTKLADGETYRDGIPEKLRAERFEGSARVEPLFDIEQADMNANGYLRMRSIAADRAQQNMTVAPHNFGSKLGFYSQIHLGLVTPNWEFSETDDSQFPAFQADGFEIRGGLAKPTGQPGLGVSLREEHLEKPLLELECVDRGL